QSLFVHYCLVMYADTTESYSLSLTTLFRSGEGMGLLPVPQLCEPIGPLGRGALDATLGDPLDHRREDGPGVADDGDVRTAHLARSEEHTSELQSRENLVCRLLLEKKNNTNN